MRNLTQRQREVLEYIGFYIREHQVTPTRMQISEFFGFSSANSAQGHIDALVKKGYLKKGNNGSIILTKTTVATFEIRAVRAYMNTLLGDRRISDEAKSVIESRYVEFFNQKVKL